VTRGFGIALRRRRPVAHVRQQHASGRKPTGERLERRPAVVVGDEVEPVATPCDANAAATFSTSRPAGRATASSYAQA
jgi:hypothetical protein